MGMGMGLDDYQSKHQRQRLTRGWAGENSEGAATGMV